MNGLIVIEGPDCTGKTTLCERLMKTEIPVPLYIHATYPYEGTTDVREYHMRLLKQAIDASATRLVILDRLWPSELVYGSLYRGGCQFPGYEVPLDRLVRRAGGIYVFSMYGTTDEYLAFAGGKIREGRNEFYTEKLASTYDAYETLFQAMSSRADVIDYRWGGNHGERLEDFISRLLRKMVLHQNKQLLHGLVPTHQNLSGHTGMSKILFVGDKPNVKEGEARFPFVGFNGCTPFMREEMELAGLPDHLCCFTNINEPYAFDVAVSFLASKKPVVLMGKEALRGLNRYRGNTRWAYYAGLPLHAKLGVASDEACRFTNPVEPHGGVWKISHPQFYRRFWRHEHLLKTRIQEIMRAEEITVP